MNRRRTSTPHLGFGSVVLLITAGIVMASAGVFHAYVKNRQVNVSRDIQRVEERTAQHELDIKTSQMRLAEEQNRFLIGDRLREISSDLRPIAVRDVREIAAARQPEQEPAVGDAQAPQGSAPLSPSPELAHRSRPPGPRLPGPDVATASGP